MSNSKDRKRRARRSFTPEFKAEIVELCQRGDRSIGQVSRDFELTETAVRDWVRQAEVDAGYLLSSTPVSSTVWSLKTASASSTA